MKRKLKGLARKSPIMDVSIIYGTENINFNLADELKILENDLNRELKDQPTHVGFLRLLLVKLNTKMVDAKAELDKVGDELFIEYKDEVDNNTGRPYSKDVAMSYTRSDEGYQEALKHYTKTVENHGIIHACVESFNSRGFLIQTLSANTRDEKKLS